MIGYDEPCLNDPMGEGLHYFDESDRCKYCGALDPLRATPVDPFGQGRLES